ncbi:MAG: SHOCT domain-containing protein [Actinobacteria bacterium]|nr:SHOCT domain-containing protein [Actinomycetota bacterium]
MFNEPSWGPEWVDGLSHALAPGEKVVGYSRCYTEIWHERFNARKGSTDSMFGGLRWQQVALTNANVWLMSWRTERVRTGILSSRIDTFPEPVNTLAIPLTHITSLGARRVGLQTQPRAALRRVLGQKPQQVSLLELTYPGGAVAVMSPYLEFEMLVQNLQRAMTGSALASASGTMADAVSKLAALRNEGLLSEEEFERAKSGFVGRSVELTESSASLIRQLAQLRDAGILTDAEFRIKKWDILSRPG